MQYPQVEENGLIRLAVTEFQQILKPLFDRVGPRAFVSDNGRPYMHYEDSWFGQGVYLREGWGMHYAVIELNDHFLIIPEGEIGQIWHQEKFGMKRCAPWHAPNMTFAGHDLIDGLRKLDAKYP
jgi:hypothetical protein